MAKVLLGMSGGVDSSVALALLQDAGHEVTGITLKMLPRGELYDDDQSCCSLTSVLDARLLADEFGIPHYQRNVSARFEEDIINPFVQSYAAGETPNPCVLCNKKIKFGDLYEQMIDLGFDYIATGHYAKIEEGPNGELVMSNARDDRKDQTYFLYQIKQEQLKHILFPLADLTKDEVREIARERGLSMASKHDSEDICFVKSGEHANFIKQRNPELVKSGTFVDQSGRELGTHDGIVNYTQGQRRGLGISLGERTYVTEIRPKTSQVVLGRNEDLMRSFVELRDCNWLMTLDQDKINREGMTIDCKVRHSPRTSNATIQWIDGDRAGLYFPEGVRAPAKGQSAVCYLDRMVVGGGIIDRSEK